MAGLREGLEARGHRVCRVGPGAADAWPGPLLPARVAFNLTLPRRLRGAAYDLLVGFDLDGCFLPRRRDAPLVVCLKGVAADERRFESGRARAELGVAAALEARNAHRADRVTVPSRHSAGRAAALYRIPPERVAVVPEGIRWAEWRDAEPAIRSGGGLTVLSVARQYRRKHTVTLLEALARLGDALPRLEARVVGGGPELRALRRRAARLGVSHRVTLLGEVAGREAVRREYLAADLFCLPSLQEGFGIVFLEAMAAGLPVVACRATSVPEVVPDGEAGLLCPPADPDAVAAALLELARDPERRQRMGRAGRRRAEAHDWRAVAGRFLDAVGIPSGAATRRPVDREAGDAGTSPASAPDPGNGGPAGAGTCHG